MLLPEFGEGALKGALPGQPLIDHDTQRVLIASPLDGAFKCLWRHILQGSRDVLGVVIATGGQYPGNAKVAQQHVSGLVQEEIGRLEVTMDHPVIMRVL